jgi:flagellar motor switch protein FliN/FliY
MADEVLSSEEIEALVSQGAANAAHSSTDEETADGSSNVVDVAGAVSGQSSGEPAVKLVEYSHVRAGNAAGGSSGIELIMDVQLQVTVELGRSRLTVREVLGLGAGSVVELDKRAGEAVEVVVNNKTVARGEVVVIDENFGVRITEIVSVEEVPIRAKAA